MATVFEERSTYDPIRDPVATLTLTVECNPGQVADLSNFLVGVSAKAGVYSVAMDHVVAVPDNEVADVERPLQRPDERPGTADGGDGAEAAAGGTEESGHADANGELAGAPGKSRSGSVGWSA